MLELKKTERSWNEWLDKIVFTNVPKWFEFIGWLFLIGAMSYLAKTTDDIYVKILYAISYVFLSFYILRYFFSIDFILFPFIKSIKIQFLISLVLSLILGFTAYSLIQKIIPHFIS
jgi:hypothetical protein